MRRSFWLKMGVGVLLLVGVPWLFLKTIQNTIAEPYSIGAATVTEWTLHVQEMGQPIPALITLVPSSSLVPQLFQQVFHRTMQSLMTPSQPGMPIVLQGEFLAGLQDVFLPNEILAIARTVGLEQAQFNPVCMAVRREPSGGRTRQLFFVVFETPAFNEFRQELAKLYKERGGVLPFDPAALELVLPVASSDADFAAWWPLEVDRVVDCRAPIT